MKSFETKGKAGTLPSGPHHCCWFPHLIGNVGPCWVDACGCCVWLGAELESGVWGEVGWGHWLTQWSSAPQLKHPLFLGRLIPLPFLPLNLPLPLPLKFPFIFPWKCCVETGDGFGISKQPAASFCESALPKSVLGRVDHSVIICLTGTTKWGLRLLRKVWINNGSISGWIPKPASCVHTSLNLFQNSRTDSPVFCLHAMAVGNEDFGLTLVCYKVSITFSVSLHYRWRSRGGFNAPPVGSRSNNLAPGPLAGYPNIRVPVLSG